MDGPDQPGGADTPADPAPTPTGSPAPPPPTPAPGPTGPPTATTTAPPGATTVAGGAATPAEGGFTAAVMGNDWPATVADTIEGAVASVHDRFIRPAIVAARGIVFGLIIATMALILIVLLTVALIRFLVVYVFNGRVWPAYLVVGGLFCIGGIVAWTRRGAQSGSA